MSKLRILLSFALGVGFGSVLCKAIFEKTWREEHEEDLRELTATLNKEIERVRNKVKEETKIEENTTGVHTVDKDISVTSTGKEKTFNDYASMVRGFGYLKDEKDKDGRKDELELSNGPPYHNYQEYMEYIRNLPIFKKSDIFPITEDDFGDDFEDYDQVFCTYHSKSEIMMEDSGHEIDPYEVFGRDWKNYIFEEVIYFCNTKLENVYEVIIEDD